MWTSAGTNPSCWSKSLTNVPYSMFAPFYEQARSPQGCVLASRNGSGWKKVNLHWSRQADTGAKKRWWESVPEWGRGEASLVEAGQTGISVGWEQDQ